MALCTTFAYVAISLLYVPACLVDERYCGRCHSCGCGDRCRPPTHPAQKKQRRGHRLMGRLAPKLYRWRCSFCMVPMLISVAFGYVALWKWVSNPNVESLFPEGHNLNLGLVSMARFQSVRQSLPPAAEPALRSELVCAAAGDPGQANASACAFSWCEARRRSGPLQTCTCSRRAAAPCGSAPTASAEARFVGLGELCMSEFEQYFAGQLLGTRTEQDSLGLTAAVSAGSFSNRSLPPQLLQVWETSAVEFAPVTHVRVEMSRTNASASSCGWTDFCFCSDYACKPPVAWDPAPAPRPDIAVPSQAAAWGSPWAEAAAAAAGSAAADKARRKLATVDVVFGLQLPSSMPLIGELDIAIAWNFKASSRIADPIVQRALYTFCMELPAELRVSSRSCWIEDFRSFLIQKQERFPTSSASTFDGLLRDFLAEQGPGDARTQTAKAFLWRSGGSVKACTLSFQVDVDSRLDPSALRLYKAKWDAYVEQLNGACQDCGGVVHTSELWVKAQSHWSFMRGSAVTLGVALILAGLILSVSLKSLLLSIYALVSALSALCGLAFFMVVLAGWSMGQVQVIALLIGTGFALNYSVYVLHAYASDQAMLEPPPLAPNLTADPLGAMRLQRVGHALRAVGSATLVGSVARFGCGFCLALCGLTLFRDVGISIMIIIPLAAFAALVPLPAALLMSGPEPGSKCIEQLLWGLFQKVCRKRSRREDGSMQRGSDKERSPEPTRGGKGLILQRSFQSHDASPNERRGAQ
mmetsp:Transcript_67965/g.219989  ORF Transcript_67965/g.219989 Transcript_67965/m.219989 type:complete len:754 (+) Transcript_67965:163-2424(+)